jgi:hypothetical protein
MGMMSLIVDLEECAFQQVYRSMMGVSYEMIRPYALLLLFAKIIKLKTPSLSRHIHCSFQSIVILETDRNGSKLTETLQKAQKM